MIQMKTLLKKIHKRKGDYHALAAEIGISYWSLYRIASGQVTDPRASIWDALQKWGKRK